MLDLSEQEWAVLRKLLTDRMVQNMIGGEEWSLTEEEEMTLWLIIKTVEA